MVIPPAMVRDGTETTATANAAPASASGSISGVIKRKDDGQAADGATIILECTCMQEPRFTEANANGLYSFRNLTPGTYVIQAIHDGGKGMAQVEINRGTHERVSFKLQTAKNQTTVNVKTKQIRADSATGIELSAEAIDKSGEGGAKRDPVSGAANVAASGGSDAGGWTLAGVSSAEQNVTVDGLRVNDPSFGTVAFSTLTEFIGSVQVLEAGYSAEYGQATGGQVRARRVAGGQKVRGTARFTFTPRLAKPRVITGTDNAIRATETPDYAMTGVVRASGPFVGEKPETELGKKLEGRLFWVLGLSANGSRSTLRQTFHHRVDKNGSGGFERCPYENGAFDCADGKDFIATKQFADQTHMTRSVGGQALAGIDFIINPKHRIGATFRVQPGFLRRSYRRPAGFVDPDSLGANPNATLGGASTVANGVVNGAFGWDRSNAAGGSVEYQGRVAKNSLEIDATVGFLQQYQEDAWRIDNPGLLNEPMTQINDNQGKNLFALLDREARVDLVSGVKEACNDRNLPGLSCPVRSWVGGGIGPYAKNIGRRWQADFALTHFFDAAGAHQLKYGAQFDHLSRRRVLRYSGSNDSGFYDNCGDDGGGGEYCYDADTDTYDTSVSPLAVNNNRQVNIGSNDPNRRFTRGYGRVQKERGDLRAIADELGNGVRVDKYDERVTTQNYAAFIQDNWALGNSVFLDAGVRWEMQDMRDILGRPAIRIADNVAPRAGIRYDWTQEGRSRLFANYGWFYQPMPLSLINRTHGGLVNVVRSYDHAECNGRNDLMERPKTVNGQPTEYCTDFGEFTTGLQAGSVVPRLKGQFDHAFQFGYQQEIIEDLTLEVRWLHRNLGRAVEDISTDGGSNFIVANPGVAVSDEDIASKQAECDGLEDELNSDVLLDDVRRAEIARDLQRCNFLVDAYEKVGTLFDKPTRNYDAFSIQMQKRWGNGWMLVGSYTYTRQIGNYMGFVDPVTGAVNVGASVQYDIPELVRNNFGPLPFEQRHRARLTGFYRFDLEKAGALALGGSVVYASGFPINVRAGHNRYQGAFPVHLISRGSGGRMKPNYQANINIEYAYPIGNTMALGVGFRFFNVTNSKAVLRVDDRYSFQNSRPIAGGDLSDLKHAKIQDPGRPTDFFRRDIVEKQGNYGVETAFQLPLAAQFDVRLSF